MRNTLIVVLALLSLSLSYTYGISQPAYLQASAHVDTLTAENAVLKGKVADLTQESLDLYHRARYTEEFLGECRSQLREDDRAAWERAKRNLLPMRAWKAYHKRCPSGENGTEGCWAGEMPAYDGDPTGSFRFLRRGPIPGVSELERLGLLRAYGQL